jgi:serine/threonine protein kinase
MSIQLIEHAVIAGRFRLNHPIGRGGMGSVWHATHLGLDIPCAVKFIEGAYASVAEAQARFEREAKAAATLRSPHVVQILDHGVCEGTPYIAMELLEGEDLGKRLLQVGKLSPRDVHGIVTQVCRALSKAHGLAIVHRDLKPDNIFLVRDDDREIAKVLDFGIAKRDQSSLQGSNTKTGAMLGTPYYMSPEQAQGTKSVDFRSDLWSLGVIVYQCATGLLPFESEALGDLLMKIIVHPLPVPSQLADVPMGFDAWWAKAAARDPAARFQSAKDFADALGLVCGISQVSGVTDRAEVYGGMGGTPHRGALGMATPPRGGPEKPLASTTGGSMVQTYNYGDDANGAVPKKRMPMGLLAIGGAVVAAAVVAGVIVSMRGKAGPASSASSPLPAETTAQIAPAAPTVPAVPAAETLAPPTREPPPALPAAASSGTAQAPKGTTTPHGANAANAARPPPGAPKTAPPTAPPGSKPAAPPKGDLGF